MKTIPFLLGVSLLLAGCGDNSKKTAAATNATSSANSPLTAPVDYLGAVAAGKQKAVGTIDTTSLDKAIQLFEVENGRNPKDLNELVEKKFIPKLPEAPYGTKLVYDATSGTVKVVKE